MAVITSEWVRKSFRVKAVQVTRENYLEIADWTGGEVVWKTRGASYVKIDCGSKKESRTAFAGDWVTCLITYNDGEAPEEPNFRVYNNSTFLQAFKQIMSEADKFAKIHNKLMMLIRAQDSATYHGESSAGMIELVDKTARELCEMVTA
jgi:hypothetical protein